MNVFRKVVAGALALVMAAGITAGAPKTTKAAETASDAGKVSVVRLGGSERFDTSAKISAEGWKKSDTVVIANAFNYADALAGSPLAYALDAPILLTYKEYVPRGISSVISDLGAKKVIILGGSAAVSSDVEKTLKASGLEISRIAGQTRYETADKIAEALRKATGTLSEAFIASGVNYPDALSASSAAALKHAPILYSPANGNLDGDTVTFIKTAGIKTAYILGGEAAVGKNAQTKLTGAGVGSVTRLGGSDRYETSLKIAVQFDDQFKSGDVAFATGKNFPDALAGSVLAAKKSIPVLLTDNATIRDDVKAYTGKKKISKVYVFGGQSVVSDNIINGYFSSPAEIKEGASIEDGKLVIRVAVPDDGLAWAADEMAQDDTVLKYNGSEVKDGFFTARYTPAGDGVMAVCARHYFSNTICDELRSWDVTVKGGKITGISDVTVKKSPDEASQDAKLSGSWIEDETEFTKMTVAKNESSGWNVEISAPMTHGAYVFKATVYYDCELDAFVYNKGKFFALNTDGTYNSEAAVAGAEGSFKLGGTDKKPSLVWHSSDDRAKDFVSKDITYVRVAESEIKEGASIEDGKLVIRVAVPDDGLAWAADEMAQDDTVLKYNGSEVKDGFFTARYTPAGDGVMAVCARHYFSNTICDELRSWDVTVKGGKITGISDVTVKKSPDEASQDAKLSGSWIEDETEFTKMTVAKNESSGWNVEISAPMTHGAYVFKATVYYDCELDAFVYNKGKFFALNTDGTYNSEAAVAGAEGSFKLGGTDKKPSLVWHSSDDRAKDFVSKDITYVRVAESEIKEGASIEDGKLVIRVAVPDDGLAWVADEMAQDDTVLKYDGSEVKDGFFTARYTPAGDGKMAVHAFHYYTACACDEMRTWEIEVKKGSVSDISEVSIKKNPADDELDSLISGFWNEDKTEYTNAAVSKNKSRGWDIGITAPKDHGAFIFEATAYYDCSLDAFVYDKGKFFDQPADGSDNIGEAKIAGATGSLFLKGADKNNLKLVWHSDDDRAKKYVSEDKIYVRIPVIINHDDDVKAAVYQIYNSSYPDIIEEIKYNTIKVYTKEEIAADETLKDHKIGDNDVVFEINYDLKVVDGYKDIMQFTAGSGEINGNWVVNKSNVGILRYVSEGAYTVDAFGTGF